jgi:2-dehydropantoate 2-reductase
MFNKVCIVGAGAIGGLLGARFAATGRCTVSALARGETLAALREHGWRLQHGDAVMSLPMHAADDARELGVQDLVVIAVKGPAIAQVARSIGPLMGPDTAVLPAVNGVPWWFTSGVAALGDEPLASVDPGGAVAAALPAHRVIGCVVHAQATRTAPGCVTQGLGKGLIVGEAEGGDTARLHALHALLGEAGFDATLSADIRRDVWFKLWGNVTMNPVSALTGATADRILDDPLVRAFCSAAMQEAAAIGERIGCRIDQSPEDRHAVTRKLGAFKTSMLQDAEAGRPLELDAIVGAVHEIGARVGVATPCIDALLGLTRLFARGRGLDPGSPMAPG